VVDKIIKGAIVSYRFEFNSKFMTESDKRKIEIKGLPGTSRANLEALINDIVETGVLSAEDVSGRLKRIRESTGRRAKAALEIVPSKSEKILGPERKKELLAILEMRFMQNMNRHSGMEWVNISAKLEASPEKMWSLNEMERTGGEPDVVAYDLLKNEYLFFDCSAESPVGRKDITYDERAQDFFVRTCPDRICNGNAVEIAEAMGIDILTADQYRFLQTLGEFDVNSLSWLKTPDDIRQSSRVYRGFRTHHRGKKVRVGVNECNIRTNHRSFRGVLNV
jgi:hypothetical protein